MKFSDIERVNQQQMEVGIAAGWLTVQLVQDLTAVSVLKTQSGLVLAAEKF